MSKKQHSFEQFDAAHPEHWDAFEKISLAMCLKSHRTHLVIADVIERVRPSLHLSNDYKPRYTRKFNAMYPNGLQFRVHRLKDEA